jgi:hypothetical protein
VDFKAALDEKIKWGVGFRGTLHKSLLVEDLARVKLGNEKKRGGR